MQDERYEIIRRGECDSCAEFDVLNRYCLCPNCEAENDVFNRYAQLARKSGSTREDAFKAGNDAVRIFREAKESNYAKTIYN